MLFCKDQGCAFALQLFIKKESALRRFRASEMGVHQVYLLDILVSDITCTLCGMILDKDVNQSIGSGKKARVLL